MNPESEHLQHLIRRFKLDCRHPDELGTVMKMLDYDLMRPAIARKYIRKIRPWIKQQIEEGNYLPMPPTGENLGLDAVPFDVPLGDLVERPDVPFGMHISNGVHHIIVFGKPDAGKTVTLKVYFKGVHEFGLRHPDQKKCLIVFDGKRDLPNPEKLFGDNVVHVSIHEPDKIRFGLNGPAGVPWTGNISTIVASRRKFILARGCLATTSDWLAPILNPDPLPAQPPTVPSLRLIRDVLANSPSYCWGEKPDYVHTLIQNLNIVLVDSRGLFDAEMGFDINHLIAQGKHIVIDVANFEPAYLRHMICDIIIMQILTHRIHHHHKTKRTEIIIAWDEADLFVTPSAQAVYWPGLSPITLLARLGREYGIQFVLGVSALQNVAPYLLSGADCTIAMGCVDPLSITCARSALGLERGTERLLPTFPPGRAIVRLAYSPYPYPFLVQVHDCESDHTKKSRPYDTVPFTKARGLDELPTVQEALEERIRACSKNRLRRRVKAAQSTLGKRARTFLDHMSLHEYEPLEVVFSYMEKVAVGTQKKIVDTLAHKKIIKAKTVRTGRSWTRFGQITEQGWQYLGKTSRYPSLRGDVVHTNVCYEKQRLDLKQGFEQSFCEHRLEGNSGFHDVVSIKNGKYYVTEVLIACDTNLVKHARDCLINSQIPVETLTVVTLLKSEHSKLRDMIMADPDLVFHIQRVCFLTVEDILKELYR